MEKQTQPLAVFTPNITPTKTRKEFCEEYDMSYKVFTRKLEFHQIVLPSGVITPKYQYMIYEAFGVPPPKPPKKEVKGK